MAPTRDQTGFDRYPSKLTLALTDRCNLKCFICTREEFEAESGGRGEHLPQDCLHAMAEPIRHAEIIQLSGFGETFLYPKFEESLRFIYDLNPRDNLIYLISNGTLLSRKWGELLDGRLNYLAISLNAANPQQYREDMHPYLYKYTRETAPAAYRGKRFAEDNDRERPCEFEKVLAAISDFMSALGPESRKRVGLHYVVHAENFAQMPDFVELAHRLGVSVVDFNPYLVNRIEHIDYSLYFHKEAYNRALDEAQALARRYGIRAQGRHFGQETKREFNQGRDCQWPSEQSLVMTRGNISACCFSGGDFMGHIFQEGRSFEDIWFGQGYARLRRERYLSACQTCNLFQTFDDWRTHFHPRVKLSPRFEEVAGLFAEEEKEERPAVLVIGAGRDGTRSAGTLAQALYGANAEPVRLDHQGESFRIYGGVMSCLNDGNLPGLRRILNERRATVVAGNGLGFVLPQVREILGPDVRVVHLKRERQACVESLVRQARAEPLYWTGYLEGEEIVGADGDAAAALAALNPVRPTAVDFGEMTAREWLELDLRDRLRWYYDKTHQEIEAHLGAFEHVLQLETENLSRPETVEAMARLIDPAWQAGVPPVHLNASVDRLGGKAAGADGQALRALFAELDLQQILTADTHLIARFLQRWLDSHGGAPGPMITEEFWRLDDAIAGTVTALERGDVAERQPVPGDGDDAASCCGLDDERRTRLALLFDGIDWAQVLSDPVYPLEFWLSRIAQLRGRHSEGRADLIATYRYLADQIESLHDKVLSVPPPPQPERRESAPDIGAQVAAV